MQQLRLQYLEIDQCMYGALGKEPTGLIVPRASVFDVLRCNHSESHTLLVRLDDNGQFRTTPAAKYPVALCCALAECFMKRLVLAHEKHYMMPQSPLVLPGGGLDPWQHRFHVSWPWPQPGANFLASLIEACNCLKYAVALENLNNELLTHHQCWGGMTEEEQDS